jgi:hypothetical protein
MLKPIRTKAHSPRRKGAGAHASDRLRLDKCVAPERAHRRRQHLRLDGQATEAIRHFAWLLVRSGFSRDEAVQAFRAACDVIPSRVGAHGIGSGCTADEASHVITLWYMRSEYLDRRGHPLPLPLGGPAPSLEALVQLVNPALTLQSVLRYLNAGRGLTRRGDKYLPRGRAVALRPGTTFHTAHHLRAVSGLLRTIEHNARGKPQWFEYLADGIIPESKLRSTMRDFRPTGMEMLQYADAFMLRRSQSTQRKGKELPLSVGVYVFEGRTLPPPVKGQNRVRRSPHHERSSIAQPRNSEDKPRADIRGSSSKRRRVSRGLPIG